MQTMIEFLLLWTMFSMPLALVVARCIAAGSTVEPGHSEPAPLQTGWQKAS